MPALPEFRENAARAISICGMIDEALLHRLMPVINRLRGEGHAPITAYIDSRGGVTHYAEQIRQSLVAPDQDGYVCRLITVGCNRASSAAADFLALGDYALSYPNATINCHGTRLPVEDLTTEKAESLAASLRTFNEGFALRLARRAFQRMAFHFANLRQDFQTIRRLAREEDPENPMETDLECFAFAIHQELSPPLKRLPAQAFSRHELLRDMRNFVFADLKEPQEDEAPATAEARVLNRLIEFELTRQDLQEWRFSKGGLAELAADFAGLIDYMSGPHRNEMASHIRSFGPLFLKPKDLERFAERLASDPRAANRWLRRKVEPLIEPLWFFTVSLCRLLQTGEYSLTAVDAYWLGLVDEVIGEQLPNLRLIAEDSGDSGGAITTHSETPSA
jgi:ATP-dependent protease ClpP protease subunit